MGGTVHVRPEPPRAAGDLLECAAEVRWPRELSRPWRGPLRQRVWVRVPAGTEPPSEALGDAFLLAVIFRAMRRRTRVRLHGPASEDLVASLGRLQALWEGRQPGRYRGQPVACERLAAPAAPRGEALLAFSGGLDSAYSLFRHTRGGAPPRLGAAVMVRGADIPVAEGAAFARARERSRRMTDSVGVPLLEAATNLRDVKSYWPHSSNAGLAAVLTLFRTRFGAGRVAVGFTEEEGRRWWPQDVTDPPLLSTAAFPIQADGVEADRFEKLAAILAWPEAMANLRVCMDPAVLDRNCGECFKCLVLGLFAFVLGHPRLPCLPRAYGPADLERAAATGDPNTRLRLAQAVRHARRLGLDAPWLDAVEARTGPEAPPTAG